MSKRVEIGISSDFYSFYPTYLGFGVGANIYYICEGKENRPPTTKQGDVQNGRRKRFCPSGTR